MRGEEGIVATIDKEIERVRALIRIPVIIPNVSSFVFSFVLLL